MADPSAPDVPAGAAGLPPVNATGTATVSEVTVTAQPYQYPPIWAIQDSDGASPVDFDVFVALDLSGEYAISSYPVEDGGFQSYNKVKRPFEGVVTLAKAGDLPTRTAFLKQIETLKASTDFFVIVTPEKASPSVTFTRSELSRRSDKNVGMLAVDIHFEQVRTTAMTAYSQTAAPSGAAAQSAGTVQATTPTPAQAAATAGGAS